MPELKEILTKLRSGHGNKSQVAKRIGISPQLLGQYEQGRQLPKIDFYKKWKTAYGEDLIEMIGETNVSHETEKLTQVEENRRSNVKKKHLDKIPFYDAAVVGGSSMLADQDPILQPAEYIDPGDLLRGATGTLRVYGQSMFPKYPSGCIIAFKNSTSNVIVWGEDYVIELSDRRIVKRVVKSQEKDCIKAVSYNTSNDKYVFDPIDIPKTEIKRLYIVLGKVEMEASV
jgi:transcriptional regulator with XRE-family HTH domain